MSGPRSATDVRKQLESGFTGANGTFIVSDGEALTSIAISLRRLADVADCVAMGMWNYDPSLTPDGKPRGGAVQ